MRNQVDSVVRSDRFANAWEQMNRTAHEQMVAVLTGDGSDTVTVEGGAVNLDLGAVIDEVKTRLAASGFALADSVPDFAAELTIFESSDITKGQTALRLLSALARGLPVVASFCGPGRWSWHDAAVAPLSWDPWSSSAPCSCWGWR